MYANTLVLNFGVPYKVVDWKTAVTNMCKGKYIVIRDYEEILAVIGKEAMKQFPELKNAIKSITSTDAESITLRVPAVVILKDNIYNRKNSIKFSRVNLYARDKLTCQYCGIVFHKKDLTFDHVLPKAQGGKTSWENIVTACKPCNSKKNDKTPEEAGMPLINGRGHVKKPKFLPVQGLHLNPDNIPKEWVEFAIPV